MLLSLRASAPARPLLDLQRGGASVVLRGPVETAGSIFPCLRRLVHMDHAIPLSRLTAEDNQWLAATIALQGPRLRAFVRRRVDDLSAVEDIVQDTFFELISAHRIMQPIEHVTAWLLRVAGNRVIDRFRLNARETSLDSPEADLNRITATSTEPGPESAYMSAAVTSELIAALEELPAAQREVFVAHELDGRSFKELAAATGIGVNTLLGRKHAAVGHLRRRLLALRSEFD
jgi:RNA polymerase sigma factor (sigma-70 family)